MIMFDAVFYFMTYLLIRFGYFPVDFLFFKTPFQAIRLFISF